MTRSSSFAPALLILALTYAQDGVAAPPLSLSEAINLAVAQSPQLASQRALADGASVGIIAAGALPDPKLKIKLENVATTTFERFTAPDYISGGRV
jgi:hypothetical protein